MLWGQVAAGSFQFIVAIVMQVIKSAYNFPFIIRGQKCFEQILFIPKFDFIFNPACRVIFRRKNIVNMYYYTLIE